MAGSAGEPSISPRLLYALLTAVFVLGLANMVVGILADRALVAPVGAGVAGVMALLYFLVRISERD